MPNDTLGQWQFLHYSILSVSAAIEYLFIYYVSSRVHNKRFYRCRGNTKSIRHTANKSSPNNCTATLGNMLHTLPLTLATCCLAAISCDCAYNSRCYNVKQLLHQSVKLSLSLSLSLACMHVRDYCSFSASYICIFICHEVYINK